MIEEPAPEVPVFDPFDVKNCRIDQRSIDQLVATTKNLTCPCRRASDQDFFRVHPDDEKYSIGVYLLEHKADKGEKYLVTPPSFGQSLVKVKGFETQIKPYTLYLWKNRRGDIGFWPVRLPLPDDRQNNWWLSARMAVADAKRNWVRVYASGGAYTAMVATAKYPDPEWPKESLSELLKLSFQSKFITSLDHPILKMLSGNDEI